MEGDLWYYQDGDDFGLYVRVGNAWSPTEGGVNSGGGGAFSRWVDGNGDDFVPSANIEYSPPNQDYNFATFYFFTNPLHWNEYAYFRYYRDTSTTYHELFRHKGAGDGGGSVVASNTATVPLYPNAQGQKVVRVTWSNLSFIRGKWWS